MTAGTVVVLGEVGRNFGAGMTGGRAYVLDPDALLDRRLNDELVVAGPASEADLAEVRALLERHLRFTESAGAASVLEDWARVAAGFRRIAPRTQAAVLAGAAEGARL
jgi:glutamate synthase (NADPH/NADH) large chain